jgi:hypothetical protein
VFSKDAVAGHVQSNCVALTIRDEPQREHQHHVRAVGSIAVLDRQPHIVGPSYARSISSTVPSRTFAPCAQ